MIKTATQLKAKIRNVSGGDSKTAMTMIRVYFMERFLERVSNSSYKNQFVLKGGMLVSSLIGLDNRATMDIDAIYAIDEELTRAIEMTAQELHLPIDWLNQDFIKTPSYSSKLIEVSTILKKYGQNLKIFSLPPRFLIAMKLKSSRPTGGDLDDVVYMIYELRYKNIGIEYKDVIDAYKTLYDDFSNTYDYFLKKAEEAFNIPLEDVTEIIENKIFINKFHH